jgi:hypothetical protein
MPSWISLLTSPCELYRFICNQMWTHPRPSIPVSRALHATLTSVGIVIEELKPKYMQGYGRLSPQAAIDLNGMAGELERPVRQLDRDVQQQGGQGALFP